MKTSSRMAASSLEICPSSPMKISIIDAKMAKGMSFLTVGREMVIGVTIAAIPTMSRVLKMLLPTTLPTARPVLPLKADDHFGDADALG